MMAHPVRAGTAPSATVIGGSITGILMAAALSNAGFQVTVLERDRLSGRPQSRRGVPQDVQPHILLHRGMTVIERLLPGYRAELLERGAVPFDGGRMPWLGEYGWLDTGVSTFEVVSATRPLMESVALSRITALTQVRVCDEVSVRGLRREGAEWVVQANRGDILTTVVVDASGRSSRLGQWLPDLAPPIERVDARVGYASRLYRQQGPMPLRTGVMIFATVELGMAGLALPVEDDGWLVAAAGFGDRRPPRDEAGFDRYLAGLRDPALADLTAALDPVGDVAVHRQTANLRRRWDRVADWPDGLLVVGDALCALDPVYGQGITVAAQQAELVARTTRPGMPVDRALQRRMVAVTEAPWSIATTNDLRMPSCSEQPSTVQRWSTRWAGSVGRLAAAGNVRATRTIASINNLMTPPVALFHPALVASVVRGIPSRRLPRPAVLDELSRVRRQHPQVGPAGA
jgi:flavin-dependent dehydrogenase